MDASISSCRENQQTSRCLAQRPSGKFKEAPVELGRRRTGARAKYEVVGKERFVSWRRASSSTDVCYRVAAIHTQYCVESRLHLSVQG